MDSPGTTPRFGRLLTAMVTPFEPDGRLDLDGAARLAQELVAAGNEGLVVTGSTGESPTLSDEERIALWRSVVAAVDVPVLAGATSNDTAHSVELTRAATEAGVTGILAVTPYYNRPPQAGLEAHFAAVAEATSLPVLLYDIPLRTGRKIASRTILRLAEITNVVGVKDAAGDLAGTARLMAEAPAGFECYSGDDALTLALCAVGAVGLIGVASHWASPELGAMLAAFFAGDLSRALELQTRLQASFAFETGEETPNPIPVKAMLRTLDLPAGQCRLPLGPAPAGLEERAHGVYAELQAARRGAVARA